MTEAAAGFRRRVGELLARMLSASPWSLTVTPHHGGMSTNAGGNESVSWYQRDADGPLPAVYVVDGAVLLRKSVAIPSLEWNGSLVRLEKILADRPWVRIPLDLLAERDPGALPAVWAMREFPWRISANVHELEADPSKGVTRYQVDPDDSHPDVWKSTWELGSDPPSLTIPEHPWERLELLFASVKCPFRMPDADEIMDAEEVWAQAAATAPRRRPAKPKGYQVTIEEGEGEDDRFPWMLRDDDLAEALNVDNNVEAEDLVREAVGEKNAKLGKKIKFDSEGDCFFAYAGSATAASQLAQLIADLVQERRG